MESRGARRLGAVALTVGLALSPTACNGETNPSYTPTPDKLTTQPSNQTPECDSKPERLGSFRLSELPTFLGNKGEEAQNRAWEPFKTKAATARKLLPNGAVDVSVGFKLKEYDTQQNIAEGQARSLEEVAAIQLGLPRYEDQEPDIQHTTVGEPNVVVTLLDTCKNQADKV